MAPRKRQLVILVNGEPYYAAQKAKEELHMEYSALRNQVAMGNIKTEIPRGKRQAYYRAKDVDQLAREMQAYIIYRKTKPTKLMRVTTKDEMKECMEISQALFGVGRETLDERMRILKKNPDTYHLLRDEDQILGYLAIMPLKPGNLDKVLKQTIPVKIDPEDIESFEKERGIDVYLYAIGVKPGFTAAEKHVYGSRLVARLIGLIIEWGEKGISIGTIAARSSMPDGIRFMKHAGFTEIESPTPERRTFVINVKESGIPYILQYKRALQEAKGRTTLSQS